MLCARLDKFVCDLIGFTVHTEQPLLPTFADERTIAFSSFSYLYQGTARG